MDSHGLTSIPSCLTRDRLLELLDRCRSLHVAVIGDVGLDIDWYIDMTASSLSRETPHFVRPIVSEEFSLGLGTYVARNLEALGVRKVDVISVVGNDWRGEFVRHELKRLGADTSNLLTLPNRFTIGFIRPILMGYESKVEDARLDFTNVAPLKEEVTNELLHKLTTLLPQLDAVFVADYISVAGIINDDMLIQLNGLAEQYPNVKFIADSRDRIHRFHSMILKPNRLEAINVVKTNSYDKPSTKDMNLLLVAAKQLNRTTNRPVYVTLGDQGALVQTNATVTQVSAVLQSKLIDPTGAGDAFSAALGTMLAAGSTPIEACALANLAASVVVTKWLTKGTTSPHEIVINYDALT